MNSKQIRFRKVQRYLIEVVPQSDLTGDQLVGQVIVLLLQTHTGLL